MDEQPKLSGPAPGFVESPHHRVEVAPCAKRIRVKLGDAVIAESKRTLLMHETNHRPVFYFPRADIRMDVMARTDHSTY